MSDLQQLAAQWQAAYRAYTDAHEANRYVAADDPAAAARIAPTYRRVARLWRELAALKSTPWWAKAAALHAAETFDHQAEVNERVAAGGQATGPHHLHAPVEGGEQ
ncbi:hypothetical protein [Saccharothrix syringae]|uniref:Uncharacterized protein n=1 Tax=Saccharothrix syringae TaxID=103733 RepID=A0A5Q0GSK2_SACSY|nr:hypothetical protein [Saccharothrix syringae]QFZ16893.1 hypothetical protein EKG83_04885 [Saccharothrix syringae]